MKRHGLLAGAVAWWLAGSAGLAGGLEADRAHHGPLDDHAVRVGSALEAMNLPPPVHSNALAVAAAAQLQWRAWYASNRVEVLRWQEAVDALRARGDREGLKRALADKKRFMHTAPSLLRHPEPLQGLLSAEQYQALAAALEQVKISLHQPGAPAP